MSGDDWWRLFTKIRPGKTGYYMIDDSGVTNRYPFLVPSLTNVAIRPTRPKPLFPKAKYKLDGSFDDWSNYKTGWKESGGTGFGVIGEDIDVKEFFYGNDDVFLYLFFKCTPTVQDLFNKTKRSGILAYLYLDSDSDKSTGASKEEAAQFLFCKFGEHQTEGRFWFSMLR